MEHLWNDVVEWCTKFSTWIIGISVGTTAKLSYELYMKRTLSFIQWIAIISLSIFVGYLSSVICVNYGWHQQGQVIVPVTTLLGEKLVVYLFENYKSILGIIIKNKKK
jgi:uncharacterized membrane protein AbrB (regulator of aidB expression)